MVHRLLFVCISIGTQHVLGDGDLWCFRRSLFGTLQPHKVTLIEPHRTEPGLLATVVHQLALGEQTDKTLQFLDSSCENSHIQEEATKLVSTNDKADRLKAIRILEKNGLVSVYVAEDSGETAV